MMPRLVITRLKPLRGWVWGIKHLAFVLILLVCTFSSAPASAQSAGKRVALVLGNGSYTKLGKLKNPGNDAADIGNNLEKLGFDTETLVDSTLGDMMEAIERFGKRLSGTEVGFFFYAGHGVQAGGTNYLIPVEADVQGEFQLKYKALVADFILETMNASGCPLNIIVLDACRDNPFSAFRSSARGLAVVGSAPAGAIIVYATDPGRTAADGSGRNGVFTEALLNHIATRGLDVKELFDKVGADVARATKQVQTPWVSSKYYGTYFLAGAAPPPQAAVASMAAQTSAQPATQPAASVASPESQTMTPAPAAAKKLGKAELIVRTVPDGADILIDAKQIGFTGDVLSIPAGAEIEVTAKNGYFVGTTKFVPSNGQLYEIDLTLEQQKGNLLFKVNGAESGKVYLDGKDIGAFGKGLFRGLPAGEHEYAIKGKGFLARGTVLLVPDTTTTVSSILVEVGSIRLNMPAECEAKVSAKGFGPVALGAGKLLEDVPVGEVDVEALGPDYDDARATLTVKRAAETTWTPWKTGGLAVATNPEGAIVSVQGKSQGQAPLVLRGLAAGKVTLNAKAEGYEETSSTVTVSLGKTSPVTIQLARSVGSFRAAVAEDVEIAIENKEFGRRSTTGAKALQALPTGDYRVEAGGPGYEPASAIISVRRNAEMVWEPWTTGGLSIATMPEGAIVSAQGKNLGRSPLVLNSLPAGIISLKAIADGYEETSETASVSLGKTVPVTLHLARSVGSFRALVSEDVEIAIESKELGRRSATGARAFSALPIGEYRVEAEGPGYEPASSIVSVSRNAETVWTPWTTGSLRVETDPPGAVVLIDGREAGQAPITVGKLPIAPVTVAARADGYEETSQTASIVEGKTTSVPIKLSRSVGSFVAEFPDGATIVLQNKEIGERKTSASKKSISLPTGEYAATATCPGLTDISTTITVRRGVETSWTPWTKGFLSFESNPGGATVLVDGVERGLTPLLLEVDAKKMHQVELRLAKHESYSTECGLDIGQKIKISQELRGLPGSIRVETVPPGAIVFLDGSFTAWMMTPCVFTDLSAGKHELDIRNVMEGKLYYSGETLSLDVGLDEQVIVKKQLARASTSLRIINAPPGSVFSIDGIELRDPKVFTDGVTMLAGSYSSTLKGPNGQEWRSPLVLMDNQYVLNAQYMDYVLLRRTIKIDGKLEDWSGIEPVFFGDYLRDKLPNNGGTKILKGYVCRDDKNIYWRMDFADGKPESGLKTQIHALDLSSGPYSVSLSLRNQIIGRASFVEFRKSGSDNFLRAGNYAIAPSSIEMSFPISSFRNYLEKSSVSAIMQTNVFSENDRNSSARTRDETSWQKLLIDP